MWIDFEVSLVIQLASDGEARETSCLLPGYNVLALACSFATLSPKAPGWGQVLEKI